VLRSADGGRREPFEREPARFYASPPTPATFDDRLRFPSDDFKRF